MNAIKRLYIKLHLYLFAFFVVLMAIFSLGEDTEIMVYIFFTCAMCTLGWLIFYLLLIRFTKKIFS